MLIATDHSAYDYDFIVQHSRLVVDTRNATKHVKQGGKRFAGPEENSAEQAL